MRLVDGVGERHDADDRPRLDQREEAEDEPEAGLAGGRRQLGAELRPCERPERRARAECDHGRDEAGVDRVRSHGEPEQGDEGRRQLQRARDAAEERERGGAGGGRQREDARVERELPRGRAADAVDDDDAEGGDEHRRPGAEDDDGREVDAGGEAEVLAVEGIGRVVVARHEAKLGDDGGRREQRERPEGRAEALDGCGGEHCAAGPDGADDERARSQRGAHGDDGALEG